MLSPIYSFTLWCVLSDSLPSCPLIEDSFCVLHFSLCISFQMQNSYVCFNWIFQLDSLFLLSGFAAVERHSWKSDVSRLCWRRHRRRFRSMRPRGLLHRLRPATGLLPRLQRRDRSGAVCVPALRLSRVFHFDERRSRSRLYVTVSTSLQSKVLEISLCNLDC